MAPMIASSGVNPSLMVLATGAGSLMFSHVNDPDSGCSKNILISLLKKPSKPGASWKPSFLL